MEIGKNTKVFLTGGNGFLGSWMAKELVRLEAQVVCLICEEKPNSIFDREGIHARVKIVKGRIEDGETVFNLLKKEKFDLVIHLAAQPIVSVANADPTPTLMTNVKGTWDLLEACRTGNTPSAIVVASSDKAYGSSKVLPYAEDTPLKGEHPYDVSKSAADLIALAYFKTYGLPIAVTRCGNIIGGGDLNKNRIVPDVSLALISGRQPIIRSDGKFTRDYVYVEDIVQAYILIANALLSKKFIGHAWNAAPGKPATVLEVVEELVKISGRSDLKPIIENKASNEIREQYLDSTKIGKELGWKPKHSLNEGLRKAYEWYSKNPI